MEWTVRNGQIYCGDTLIAETSGRLPAGERLAVNKLIAAAPRMLKTLKMIRDNVEDGGEGGIKAVATAAIESAELPKAK